jgi:uncharacterized protein
MRDLMKVGCVALLLFLSLAAPSAAGPLEDAMAAYERGDYATALRLFRPLADQGVASAQFNLGLMYANGRGAPQDDAEAVKWYRRGANQGDAASQTAVGNMYHLGRGVPQDYTEALKWFRRAADQGQASAQFLFGSMYERGEGVPQDYVQAHKWYDLAAARHAYSGRETVVKFRDRLAAKMTATQIAEAQRLAREWKPKLEKP